MQHTTAQEVETGAAEHVTLEHCETVHLSLRLPVAPGRTHCSLDSSVVSVVSVVTSQALSESDQLRYPAVLTLLTLLTLLQPRRELVGSALGEQLVE